MKRHAFGAILLLVSVFGTANAYTVIQDGDNATAILGLEILGQEYNALFIYTNTDGLAVYEQPFLGDSSGNAAARLAINEVLNLESILTVGPQSQGVYWLQFSSGSGGTAAYSVPNSEWVFGNSLAMTNDFRTHVVLSAVPIPAAVWLFGSGLGLLGFLRRRKQS